MENLLTFRYSEATNEVFIYRDDDLLDIITEEVYYKIIKLLDIGQNHE